MYKELYIQSKIIILITLNQINFCTQQTATHFLTGNLTQQFKVGLYSSTYTPTIPFQRTRATIQVIISFFFEHCYTIELHGSPPRSDIYREAVSRQSRVSPTPFHPQTRQTCTQSVKTNILQVRRPWILRNLTNMHLCKREVRNFISTTTIKNHYERGSEISAFGMRTRACWCVPSVRVCGSREGGPREIPVAGRDPSSVGKCQSWTVVGFSVYIACLHYEQSYILYE